MPEWIKYDKAFTKLRPAFLLINTIANELCLPKQVINKSISLYRRVYAKKLTQGRRLESLASACLLIIAEESNYPINIKDLCLISGCSKKSIINNKRFIKKHLRLNQGLINPESYVNKYCDELGLTEEYKTKALDCLKKININSKPSVIAAIAIHEVSGVSLTRLSRVTGLSRSNLWRIVKFLLGK